MNSENVPSDAGAPPPTPALRLKKILVPIDFSEPCRKASKYACAFAAKHEASLVLLHVLELNVVMTDMGPSGVALIEAESRENATRRLAEWKQQQLAPCVAAETLLVSGRPYWEIVEAAKSLEADLIVMASHGHSSLAHVLLGSTVERVVRHAPCPVLVVRPEQRDFVA